MTFPEDPLRLVDPEEHAGHAATVATLSAKLAAGLKLSVTERTTELAGSVLWLVEHGLACEWPPPGPDWVPPAPIALGSPLNAMRAIASPPRPRPRLVTEDFADVVEEAENYLWPNRIPLGTVTLLLGRPGEGKSTFTSWLAATVAAGLPWPDCPDDNAGGSVLVLQAEESRSRTVLPRLNAFGYGAGEGRILSVTGVDHGDGEAAWFSLAHNCGALADYCERRGDVRLIIIDPLLSFLGGLKGNNGPEVREALRPLFALAEDFDLAIVAVTHPNKDDESDILNRVTGAGAFLQLCRMSWMLSEDPRDKSRRLLSLIKSNCDGATRTGLACHYDRRSRRMTWFTDPVEMTARDVDHLLQKQAREAKLKAKPGFDPEKSRKAEALILELLGRGPMLQSCAQDQALNVGVTGSTFRRALRQLREVDGRVTRRRDPTDGRWWLQLGGPAEGPVEGGGAVGSDECQPPSEPDSE